LVTVGHVSEQAHGVYFACVRRGSELRVAIADADRSKENAR